MAFRKSNTTNMIDGVTDQHLLFFSPTVQDSNTNASNNNSNNNLDSNTAASITSSTLEDFLLDQGNWSPDDLASTASVNSNFNFVEQSAPLSHHSTSSSSYSNNFYLSEDSESNFSARLNLASNSNNNHSETFTNNESINFLNMINDHFDKNSNTNNNSSSSSVTNESNVFQQVENNPNDSQIMMIDSCFDELS
jgi:hypothetical protein